MKKIIILGFMLVFSSLVSAQADRGLDNDGQ